MPSLPDIDFNRRGRLAPAQASCLPNGTVGRDVVVPFDGRVIWTGAPPRWAPVDVTGALLPASDPELPSLPPGPFRFYFHDGRLVAAESPLDASTYWSITQVSRPTLSVAFSSLLPPSPLPVGDPESLRTVLASTLGFTSDDLESHRQGVFGPRQLARGWVGRVVAVEGPLTMGYAMRGKSQIVFRWMVCGQWFEVPMAWFKAAPPGVLYRCYMDERSQRLLSLEPIAGPASAAPR